MGVVLEDDSDSRYGSGRKNDDADDATDSGGMHNEDGDDEIPSDVEVILVLVGKCSDSSKRESCYRPSFPTGHIMK